MLNLPCRQSKEKRKEDGRDRARFSISITTRYINMVYWVLPSFKLKYTNWYRHAANMSQVKRSKKADDKYERDTNIPV